MTVTVARADSGFAVSVDGREVTLICKGDGFVVSDGSSEFAGSAVADKSRVYVALARRLFEFELVSADSVSASGEGGAGGEKDKLRAPMPGKIVKVLVEQGQTVTARQPLAVIESMKMENQLLSPGAGLVKKICFAPGDQVDTDDVLVELTVE